MKQIRIGVIGDYNPAFRPHTATDEAIGHTAAQLGIVVAMDWLATDTLLEAPEATLRGYDVLWCAPGSPYRSLDGALKAIRFAREQNWPFIGTCGGFQHVVLEYARHVLHFEDAAHAEYDPYASTLFVSALSCSLVGQTMQVQITPGSKTAGIYGRLTADEQYYCNFGLNPQYQALFSDGDLQVAGVDQDGEVRILELPKNDLFLATLFVPQLTSTLERPHPLIVALLKAGLRFSERRHAQQAIG